MCLKVHCSGREQQINDLRDTSQCSNMTTTLWSTLPEDKHDSGCDSINLPCLHIQETDISALQNDFVNMKINNDIHATHHDSGVYTSGQYSSGHCAEVDNIGALYDEQCINEYTSTHTFFNCNNSRRDSSVQLHIRSDLIHMLYEGDKDGDNKLHLSIINGHEASSLLLINLAQEYGWLSTSNLLRQTPLHLAVLTQQRSIVRRLICAGAIVLAQDNQGDTPLHIACRMGDVETVKHLLTPVHYRETLQNRYTIPYQRVPQDLRVRNYNGETCLHVAASSRHDNVVQMLLEAGADINMGDGKSGRTILHQAVDRGDTELVELLLSYGDLNVKQQDYAGLTPIQLAYGRSYLNIVKIICGLSGEYDGIHLHDTEISLTDEELSDDSDCCGTFSVYR